MSKSTNHRQDKNYAGKSSALKTKLGSVKTLLENHFGTDVMDFFIHGSKYTLAGFFTAAIAFLSMPIITRLLNPDEYGILAVFNSAVGLCSILFGLQMYGAVGRYYQEKKEDFKEFLGTTVIVLLVMFLVEGVVFWQVKKPIIAFLNIPGKLFPFLLLIAVLSAIYSIYTILLVVMYKSTELTLLSVARAIVSICISIVIIINLDSNRYLGRIWGQIIVLAIVAAYAIYKILPQMKWRFNRRHLKYSLNYNIPSVPGALSIFVLSYFDRIIINQLTNSEKVGLYSFAYNIGMVISVVVVGLNNSWGPKFIDDMRDGNYARINLLTSRYADIVIFVGLCLGFLSREIGSLMAPHQYHEALRIISFVILGYVFLFIANIYANFASYRKQKIIVISLNVITVGTLNVILNYLFIPRYGYQAAAITTVFAYFVLLWLNYLTARYLLGENVIQLRMFFRKLLPAIGVFLTVYILSGFMNNVLAVVLKFGTILLWGYWVFYKKSIAMKHKEI